MNLIGIWLTRSWSSPFKDSKKAFFCSYLFIENNNIFNKLRIFFYLHDILHHLFNIYKTQLLSFLVSSNNIDFKSRLNSVSCNMCNNASLSRSVLRKNESNEPPPDTKPLACPWPTEAIEAGCVPGGVLCGELGVCGVDAGEILNSFWRNFFRLAESSKTGILKSDDFERLDLC